MIGSTTPVAERPYWHPVHHANALLRSALLNSAAPSAPSKEFEDSAFPRPSHAISGLVEGPLRITYPPSLVARLNALAPKAAALQVTMSGRPQADGLLHDLGDAAWEHGDDDLDLGDPDAFAAGDADIDPLDPGIAPQVHVQALVREFHRRQRHVSLLVVGSLAAAFILTLGGLVLTASLATPEPAGSDNRPPARSTSIAWQRPDREATARLQFAAVTSNRAAKSEPLLVPATADESAALPGEASSAPQVILATSGRLLALAPLLPPTHARYLLLRGLPAEAELSAGKRSDSGAWFVKDEEMHDLTLSIGEAAQGDYPVEIYLLDAGNAPQGRRNLVLRVEPTPRDYAVGPNMSWASALLDVMPGPRAAATPVVPAESAVLLQRAKRLLEEGDIAAARLLLLHLAERGEGEAAYELARTFDREMLTALGARFMDGDAARARGWYERASQDGNAKAAERLKILASLSGTDPSD